MKSAIGLLVILMTLAGCNVMETPVEEVPGQIQKGIRGEGELVEQDRSDDPFVR